jgi:tRNA threonylcarbamoyladenosine biosynthesis protein TsaB
MKPADRKYLIIETSGQPGLVALAEGAIIRASRSLDKARRHARDLVPLIADLVKKQEWPPADIDAVLASRGPGSYTGLRVGLITAKTFAFATGCALLGIDTFPAIAMQAESASSLEVIADAQQDKIYVQRFECISAAEPPHSLTPLQILSVSEWLKSLTPESWVSGPGLALHRNRLPGYVRLVAESLWQPRPESLLRLGLDRLNRGERDDWASLEPLYLRPSSAEEKHQKIGK